jgi:hypothetical protein
MIGTTDYAGIAAVISAVFAGVAALVGAFNHRTVSNIDRKTDTNGDPRELGIAVTDIAAQVAPPEAPASTHPVPK